MLQVPQETSIFARSKNRRATHSEHVASRVIHLEYNMLTFSRWLGGKVPDGVHYRYVCFRAFRPFIVERTSKGYELTDRRTRAHRIYRINSPHALYSGFTQLYATRANPTSNNPPSNLTGGGINGLSFTGRRGGSFIFVEMHISPGGTAFQTFGGRVYSCKRML